MSSEALVGLITIGFAILGGLLRLVWLASRQTSTLETIKETLQVTIVDNHAEHKEFYQRLDNHETRITRVEDRQRFQSEPGGS